MNKEALLADRNELAAAELKKVGVKIVQEERFFITPHGPADHAEQSWQEAA